MPEPHILNSWKEIATYLGRGVRTVQRWEATLEMPVHRPAGKSRSAVIAMPDELQQWLRAKRTLIEQEKHIVPVAPMPVAPILDSPLRHDVYENAKRLKRLTQTLVVRYEALQEQLNHSVELGTKMRNRMALVRGVASASQAVERRESM